MEKKLKIMYVVEAMGGGVFTYLVDLINELINEYDIYLVHAVRPQTPADYISYFDSRVNFIKVKNFTRKINPIKDFKSLLEIRKIFKEINPDIIHLHSSKAGVIGRLLFNGNKIPVFYTPHGYSFLMADCSYFKRCLYKSIEKISLLRNSVTISCSLDEHNETLKLTNRAEYVNNGINISNLDSLIRDIEPVEHDFTVFTLGRICYQKNPKLFNEIALSMPYVNFIWIGDGDLRNELTATNIEVTGWLDRNSALKKAINCDAFMLTSLWEGLPISLLEAMYMKKICIVSDVIGNHDVINNEVNGYVCSKVNDFVYAINCVMSNSKGNNDFIISNMYKDIINIYNTKVMAQNYNNIYKNYLNNKMN